MRRSAVTLVAGAVLAVAGCTRVGVEAGAPAPEPATAEAATTEAPTETRSDEVFSGAVTLGAQRLPVVLELHSGGSSPPSATLRIPDVPIVASGPGRWSDGRLRLRLEYGDDCPGTVAVDARFTPRGAEGTLEARDCTGSDSGPLLLVRRTSAEMPGGEPARHGVGPPAGTSAGAPARAHARATTASVRGPGALHRR
jgi:hypothetical protein